MRITRHRLPPAQNGSKTMLYPLPAQAVTVPAEGVVSAPIEGECALRFVPDTDVILRCAGTAQAVATAPEILLFGGRESGFQLTEGRLFFSWAQA